MRKDLEKLIAKHNLGNVHLLGYLLTEELIPFYFRADVFVCPSVVAEAFGLTITEAMAAKTPVIATKKGGIPLIVKDGKNGLFIKEKSAEDIAEKCNKLLNNDELREKMGKQARKDIEDKFTWRRVAERFEFLYKIVTGDYYRERREKIKNGDKNDSKSITRMKKAELIKRAEKEGIEFDKEETTRKELIKKIKNKEA